jgi:hypothetical protein
MALLSRHKTIPTELDARIEQIRKALQKQHGRKPTMLETTTILKAAVLIARSEQAALDPDVTVNQVTRLARAARLALKDCYALIGTPERRPPSHKEPPRFDIEQ